MNIEDMPLEERQKRAGEEIVSEVGEPSVLRHFAIKQKWKVDSIIWPENMGSDLRKPRCKE